MRLLFYIAGIFWLVSSCTKQPEARFKKNANASIAGEEVRFTNTSTNAGIYEWDFGDGSSSNFLHPDHIYESSGTYIVRLTAYSEDKKKMDDFSLTVFVKQTTAQSISANVWNLDSIVTYSYTDGELIAVEPIVFSEIYSSHTTAYSEDGTYLTKLDESTYEGEWSVLLEEFSLQIDDDINYIDLLTATEFVFFRVTEFGGSSSELIDTSYTYLSL